MIHVHKKLWSGTKLRRFFYPEGGSFRLVSPVGFGYLSMICKFIA